MRRRIAISRTIQRAVLVALAPACSSNEPSGTPDANVDDVVTTIDSTTNDVTIMDAGVDSTMPIDDGAIITSDVGPPEGCVVSGKPDVFAPCGYSENISDPIVCGIDQDADIQQPITCEELCDPTEPDCVYYQFDAGGIVSCGAGCIGRLHEAARDALAGTCEPAVCGETAADWLARAATLEAASIDAFYILADELAAHGAPAALGRAARVAAKDEVRHARTMHKLASARGRSARRAPSLTEGAVPKAQRALRPLANIAIENAIEGCVRETFGAALATLQASRASDPELAAAMHAIARDETRHATLGWRIAAWADVHLTATDRARARAARAAAVRDLERSLDALPTSSALGIDPVSTRRLFDHLRSTLWS